MRAKGFQYLRTSRRDRSNRFPTSCQRRRLFCSDRRRLFRLRNRQRNRRFQLKTAGQSSDQPSSTDIPVGKYRVFFNHEAVVSPDVLDENGAIVTPAATYCDVPVKYTNPESSGLIVEITEGANFFNFNLKTDEPRDEAAN